MKRMLGHPKLQKYEEKYKPVNGLIQQNREILEEEQMLQEISFMKIGSLVLLRKFLTQIKKIEDKNLASSLRLLAYLIYAASISNTAKKRGRGR